MDDYGDSPGNSLETILERLRDETPACRDRIHFNNAGMALTPRPVQQAVLDHLALEQELGGYEAARAAADRTAAFYRNTATLLNCAPREIAWSESASHAWNTVLQSLPLKPGDRIVTGQSEYAGNYLSLLHLSRTRGLRIAVVPDGEDGRIDLTRLEQALDGGTRLLVLTHVPSQHGIVQPARQAGLLARARGIPFLLDCAQSAGQLPLDVEELGCDLLVGTGRKFLRGPRGSGFLYVRSSWIDRLEPPRADLHSAHWTGVDTYQFHDSARRFESFECAEAVRIGLSEAVAYATALGLPAIQHRIGQLARALSGRLRGIPGITVREPADAGSGIVTFHHRDRSAGILQDRLRQIGSNTSVARRDNARLDLEPRGLPDLNRASLHYYNTHEEIERFCEQVEHVTRTASGHRPAESRPDR